MIVTTTTLMFTMPGSGNASQPDHSWALARVKPSSDNRFSALAFAKISVGTGRKNEKRMFHLNWDQDQGRLVRSREFDVACNCTSPEFMEGLQEALRENVFPYVADDLGDLL